MKRKAPTSTHEYKKTVFKKVFVKVDALQGLKHKEEELDLLIVSTATAIAAAEATETTPEIASVT